MSGWIKLHRSILDFEWYEDANTMRTFLHLLLSANHEPRKWKGTFVERGQVITSRDHLATDLKLSVQQIRTALSKLEKSENITIKSTKRFTVITVCNYGTYQSEEVAINQQSNPPVTINQPTDNQQVTTNKNVRIKECKNVKDNTLVDLAEPKSTDGEILEVEVLRHQEKAEVACPYTCIVESFNATCRCLQGCRIATPTRKQALRRAWAFFEHDMAAINKFFETVNESDFLCGRRKGSNWKCSFDWIFKMNNIVKIIEGNYTNK